MAFAAPLIGLAGLAVSAVGVGVQYMGQKAQSRAIKRENAARKLAADLEARRNRRKALRESFLSRAMATAQGMNQGMFGSSIFGAQAGISNTAARTTTNINQNQEIGGMINSAQTAQANAQTMTALGGGITSLGGSIYSGSESLGRLTNFYTGTNQNGYRVDV